MAKKKKKTKHKGKGVGRSFRRRVAAGVTPFEMPYLIVKLEATRNRKSRR
jgi:hypothetical protein